MKKLLAGIIIAFFGFALFSQSLEKENQEITISRIRIYIDDVEITSEDFEGTPAFSEKTILSFTKFKANKKMSLAALEKEVQQTQLRLMSSGFFYSTTVEIVPPRKNPDKRTIIINVRTGFLLRFGGGGIFGSFGKVALGGRRNELIAYAGWNTNGISYIDENAGGLPLIAAASLFTDAPSSFVGNGNVVSFTGRATAGGFINPDWRICLDIVAICNTSTGFVNEDFLISPYVFNQHFFSEKLITTSELRFYCKPFVSFKDFGGEICQTFNFCPSEKINIGGILCGGSGWNFDLNQGNFAVSNKRGLSMRCIRSGYDSNELLLKNYIMTSFEARFKVLDFVIARSFPCNIQPFVFADVAYGQQLCDLKEGDWNFLDAYGAGIQINFDCPVFAYFNFTYGFNHQGNGKFCFYTGVNF